MPDTWVLREIKQGSHYLYRTQLKACDEYSKVLHLRPRDWCVQNMENVNKKTKYIAETGPKFGINFKKRLN